MAPPSPFALPASGTIDWNGLAVVDPVASVTVPARRIAIAGESEACLASARDFYAAWGD